MKQIVYFAIICLLLGMSCFSAFSQNYQNTKSIYTSSLFNYSVLGKDKVALSFEGRLGHKIGSVALYVPLQVYEYMYNIRTTKNFEMYALLGVGISKPFNISSNDRIELDTDLSYSFKGSNNFASYRLICNWASRSGHLYLKLGLGLTSIYYYKALGNDRLKFGPVLSFGIGL